MNVFDHVGRLRRKGAEPQPKTLAQLRGSFGLTRARLGDVMGVADTAVRRQELASDLRVSTLASYVHALGEAVDRPATLSLTVELDGASHQIVMPADHSSQPATTGSDAWKLRAHDDPRVQRLFRSLQVISVGADDVPDQTIEANRLTLEETLRRAFPETADKGIQTFLRYWRYFVQELREGDLVLVPLVGSEFALAEVVGPYVYDASVDDPRLWHRRDVQWRVWGRSRSELPDDLRAVANAQGTISRIRKPNARARLEEVA